MSWKKCDLFAHHTYLCRFIFPFHIGPPTPYLFLVVKLLIFLFLWQRLVFAIFFFCVRTLQSTPEFGQSNFCFCDFCCFTVTYIRFSKTAMKLLALRLLHNFAYRIDIWSLCSYKLLVAMFDVSSQPSALPHHCVTLSLLTIAYFEWHEFRFVRIVSLLFALWHLFMTRVCLSFGFLCF